MVLQRLVAYEVDFCREIYFTANYFNVKGGVIPIFIGRQVFQFNLCRFLNDYITKASIEPHISHSLSIWLLWTLIILNIWCRCSMPKSEAKGALGSVPVVYWHNIISATLSLSFHNTMLLHPPPPLPPTPPPPIQSCPRPCLPPPPPTIPQNPALTFPTTS